MLNAAPGVGAVRPGGPLASGGRQPARKLPPLACRDMGHDSSLGQQAGAGETPAGRDGEPPADEDADEDDTPGHQAPARLLVASNRGPLSFTVAPDGSLTARRGGGGPVSGLM